MGVFASSGLFRRMYMIQLSACGTLEAPVWEWHQSVFSNALCHNVCTRPSRVSCVVPFVLWFSDKPLVAGGRSGVIDHTEISVVVIAGVGYVMLSYAPEHFETGSTSLSRAVALGPCSTLRQGSTQPAPLLAWECFLFYSVVGQHEGHSTWHAHKHWFCLIVFIQQGWWCCLLAVSHIACPTDCWTRPHCAARCPPGSGLCICDLCSCDLIRSWQLACNPAKVWGCLKAQTTSTYLCTGSGRLFWCFTQGP